MLHRTGSGEKIDIEQIELLDELQQRLIGRGVCHGSAGTVVGGIAGMVVRRAVGIVVDEPSGVESLKLLRISES